MNKALIGIVAASLLVLVGGFFFFSNTSNSLNLDKEKVDEKILVRDDSFKISSPTSKITLVEFGDYQCPACSAYHPLIKQLIADLGSDLTIVFRQFPLEQIHKNARLGAYAVEAANEQNKFLVMHNKLYEDQKNWSLSDKPRETVIGYAKELGLNVSQFEKDLDSEKIKTKVNRDIADATAIGVNSTPSFYLNNKKMNLPSSYEELKKIVKGEIDKKSSEETYHAHFDLKIYLNGIAVDLSQDKYQSTEDSELDPSVHLHDGDGKVFHLHSPEILLSQFTNSIKLNIPQISGQKSLKVYVNGILNGKLLDYVPNDLDKILITYGSENEDQLKKQIESVTDVACIYSEKCPERGTPPAENCVGGIGTNCK